MQMSIMPNGESASSIRIGDLNSVFREVSARPKKSVAVGKKLSLLQQLPIESIVIGLFFNERLDLLADVTISQAEPNDEGSQD